MSLRIGSRGIARALNALTWAGPTTSAAVAAGAVTRLKRAAAWSGPHLERLSGLPEAAGIAASPVLILDRHSAALHIARTLDDTAPIAGVWDLRDRAITLRTLSRRACGLWDPRTSSSILIAPNVLDAAHRHSLDQGDWSKWAALRVGLLGVITTKAPNLIDPRLDTTNFLHRLLLLDALLDALMRRLAPKDLSSIEWIRGYGPKSAIRSLASALLVDPSIPEAELLRAHEEQRIAAERIVSDGSLAARLDDLARSGEPFPGFGRTALAPTKPTMGPRVR